MMFSIDTALQKSGGGPVPPGPPVSTPLHLLCILTDLSVHNRTSNRFRELLALAPNAFETSQSKNKHF